MSLKDKASLIFKPSRYKSGKAYSFRGSDFTVSRSTTRTRVNSQGFIEDVASGVPAVSYDPSDLTKCPTISQERLVQNVTTYSEDLANSAWAKLGVNVVSNQTISPDGTNNADKVVENAVNTQHLIQDPSFTITQNLYYTFSVFVKAAERYYAGLSFSSYTGWTGGAGSAASFNLIDGTWSWDGGAGLDAGMDDYGNGWWRIWISAQRTGTSGSSNANLFILQNLGTVSYTGDGSSGFYAWGGQLENSVKHPGSYLPTTSSAATKNTDVIQADISDDSIRLNNVSLYADVYYNGIPKSNSGLFTLNFSNGYLNIGSITDGKLYVDTNNPSYKYFDKGEVRTRKYNKVVLTRDADKFYWYLNGVLINSTAIAGQDVAVTNLKFNADTTNNRSCVTLFDAAVYGQALTPAEAIALTSYDDYQELVDRNELTWESPTITNNRLTALKEL